METSKDRDGLSHWSYLSHLNGKNEILFVEFVDRESRSNDGSAIPDWRPDDELVMGEKGKQRKVFKLDIPTSETEKMLKDAKGTYSDFVRRVLASDTWGVARDLTKVIIGRVAEIITC